MPSMMNPFEDEWRACLQAHFQFVVTAGDTLNETSLITVLVETGYSEAEVVGWRKAIVGEVADEIEMLPEPLPDVADQDPLDQVEPAALEILENSDATETVDATEVSIATMSPSIQAEIQAEVDSPPTLQDSVEAEAVAELAQDLELADSRLMPPDSAEQVPVEPEVPEAAPIDPPQQLSLF